MSEPESLILPILREMRAELADVRAELGDARSDIRQIRAEFATKPDLSSEIRSLRADFASDLLSNRKELSEQIVGLRRAVMEYHTSVIGHGIMISELEARLRRVEQHIRLPPFGAT
jgi:phage shock protein A